MARKLVGLQRRGDRWRMAVRVNGVLYVSPWGTESIEDLRQWRDDQIEKFGGTPDAAGGLGEKVTAYLSRVSAMPTIAQRTAHLLIWVHELGRDRPPLSVTTSEIDIVLQGWLEDGLAAGTVRKRFTALRSFYSKIYPRKVSPTKGASVPKEPKAEARDLGYTAFERAVAAMPDTRDTKKGLPPRMSLSKIRVRVIGYSGIPPGMVQQLTSHDLVLTGKGSVRVGIRKKGGGIEARTLELSDEALAAFKAFHAANAYGPFAVESLNRSFKRGCQRVGIDPKRVKLYDARHTFLSQVYRVTRDQATVGRLGLHAEGSKATARYTKAAHQDVNAAAVAAFSQSLTALRQANLKAAPVQKPARKLPRKVTTRRKSFRHGRLKAV